MRDRVYLPATTALLEVLHETGELPAGVTRVRAEGDDEESEYAALQQAADDSAELLDGPGRRVVVVAEIDTGVGVSLADGDGPVPLARVVALHVDDADVDPADAAYADPPELGWWATQELPVLLGRD